jgi:hypothetical protein
MKKRQWNAHVVEGQDTGTASVVSSPSIITKAPQPDPDKLVEQLSTADGPNPYLE